MRAGVAWLVGFITFLAWLTFKTHTVVPRVPNHRDDKPKLWNAINYAADLVEHEGWSVNTNEKGIGGWSITQALRQAESSYYSMDIEAGLFKDTYEIYSRMTDASFEMAEGDLLDWEWQPHRTRKDVIIMLRQIAELSLD